ncbi:MAG: M24 family metallopeptidase [Chlamydiota bacterium]
MEFEQRLLKIRQLLAEEEADLLLIDNVTDIYYLTGCRVSRGKVFITPQKAEFYLDGRYYEDCRQRSAIAVRLEKDDNGLQQFIGNHSHLSIKTIAFDSSSTSYGQYQKLFENINTDQKLLPVKKPLEKLRNIKDSEELQALRRAANLNVAGFEYLCSLIKEGVTESQLMAELEIFWKINSACNPAFNTIVAFGENSALPHHYPGQAHLQKGMPILVDLGVKLGNYCSDMTRTVFLGRPDAEMEQVYSVVKEAQQEALNIALPGRTLGELDAIARKIISDAGYGEYFNHSLGHGIGLEVHEFPAVKDNAFYGKLPLIPGMVITIEPGVYLPGKGGIRIEDTIIITEGNPEIITPYPKDLTIVG